MALIKDKPKTVGNIRIENIVVKNNTIFVLLNNNRYISFPKNYTTKLEKAKENELASYRVLPNGLGIHWDIIDEDITIEPFLEA